MCQNLVFYASYRLITIYYDIMEKKKGSVILYSDIMGKKRRKEVSKLGLNANFVREFPVAETDSFNLEDCLTSAIIPASPFK